MLLEAWSGLLACSSTSPGPTNPWGGPPTQLASWAYPFSKQAFFPLISLRGCSVNARKSSRPLQIEPQLLSSVAFWLWSRIKLCNQIRTPSLIETRIKEPKKSNNSDFDLSAIFNATHLKGTPRDVWALQQPVFWILFEGKYPVPSGWPERVIPAPLEVRSLISSGGSVVHLV